MKISILISGHIRIYDYDNIRENILDVITSNGHTYDIFLSTWEIDESRDGGRLIGTHVVNKEMIQKFNPKKYIVEKNNREYFLQQYHSISNNKLTSDETCGDATSMWYKLMSAYLLVSEEYDVIIRLRSDIYYHNKINIEDLVNCISDNKLYMPIWHEKYESVTKEMMDHFFFGNKNVMDKICLLYNNIPRYLSDVSLPHTGETFLYRCIKENNTEIKRICISYSVCRMNGLEKVTNN